MALHGRPQSVGWQLKWWNAAQLLPPVLHLVLHRTAAEVPAFVDSEGAELRFRRGEGGFLVLGERLTQHEEFVQQHPQGDTIRDRMVYGNQKNLLPGSEVDERESD